MTRHRWSATLDEKEREARNPFSRLPRNLSLPSFWTGDNFTGRKESRSRGPLVIFTLVDPARLSREKRERVDVERMKANE